MKLAISGAHSQGKSTLIKHLEEHHSLGVLKDYTFATSMTRKLQEQGVVINENASGLTQIKVMTGFYERLLNGGENFLHDRCALDGMAYTSVLRYQCKITEKLFDACAMLFEEMIPSYTHIFYVKPELKLEDDGVRTVQKEFFEQTVKAFEFLIDYYKINVTTLSGTLEERSNQVINYVNTYNQTNGFSR